MKCCGGTRAEHFELNKVKKITKNKVKKKLHN